MACEYAINIPVLKGKHFVHQFHGVQTCTLKLFLLLIDRNGFFSQANAMIYEVITSAGPFNLELSVYINERIGEPNCSQFDR